MSDSFGQKIGSRIKELREKAGLSQEQVSKTLGISRVDRKSTRLNSSHVALSRMQSSA